VLRVANGKRRRAAAFSWIRDSDARRERPAGKGMRGEREEQDLAARHCCRGVLISLLPVVELRNRSINSWLILVPPGAAILLICFRGIPSSGQ
jgi:hypothetical protein